mmetsp:Transcript_94438/g.266675  ORF Transcript_94438/g.266675 Transcript_94438/m.266675 type:complete len:350 (+) Transcript_94438:83-1132(+)
MDIADDDAPTSREVALSVAAYTLCSSLAVVSNKVVLYHAPLPGMLFCVQILVTIVCTGALRCMRLIEVDALTKKNVGMFAPYIVAFVCALYANGMALSVSNVDTVIVFRASSPIMVSITDWLVLGRELPSFRSSVALLGVALGACGYVFTDSEFAMHGVSAYTWVLIYVGFIVFEMTYGKKLISDIKFESPVWGSTFYTNTLSLVPMCIISASSGEIGRAGSVNCSPASIGWLALSCITGVGISWSGWNCRKNVSATAYTVVGVACKLISVIVNVCLWNKHASGLGLCMLGVCLISSAMYKQAPLRPTTMTPAPVKNLSIDDEENPLGQPTDEQPHDVRSLVRRFGAGG